MSSQGSTLFPKDRPWGTAPLGYRKVGPWHGFFYFSLFLFITLISYFITPPQPASAAATIGAPPTTVLTSGLVGYWIFNANPQLENQQEKMCYNPILNQFSL